MRLLYIQSRCLAEKHNNFLISCPSSTSFLIMGLLMRDANADAFNSAQEKLFVGGHTLSETKQGAQHCYHKTRTTNGAWCCTEYIKLMTEETARAD